MMQLEHAPAAAAPGQTAATPVPPARRRLKSGIVRRPYRVIESSEHIAESLRPSGAGRRVDDDQACVVIIGATLRLEGRLDTAQRRRRAVRSKPSAESVRSRPQMPRVNFDRNMMIAQKPRRTRERSWAFRRGLRSTSPDGPRFRLRCHRRAAAGRRGEDECPRGKREFDRGSAQADDARRAFLRCS